MTFFLNLFTPETWKAFQDNGSAVSGFRNRQLKTAQATIRSGDVFLCYLVRLSRWCGILDIIEGPFIDDEPIFSDPDPFVVRFRVTPRILLTPEQSIPIFEDAIWSKLSLTRDLEKASTGWAMSFRGSLKHLSDEDGQLIVDRLLEQERERKAFPFSARDLRQLARRGVVRTPDGEVTVEVPDEEEVLVETEGPTAADTNDEARESIRIQAMVASIGAEMGFRIWVPRGDRARVADLVSEEVRQTFLDALPLSYDQNTLRTIEQIDVIWLKGRSMARAFEVEHTTSIFSGLLRMADLLALQPNMNIRLHIVAPEERAEKVKVEIKRPVFSLLGDGPLYKKCTYLSYEDVRAIAGEKHLSHMSDSILEEFEEYADY